MKDYGYTDKLKGPYLNMAKFKIDNPILKAYYKFGPVIARNMPARKNTIKETIILPGENNNPINCIVFSADNLDENAPTIVYFHGGGFYIGTNPVCMMVAGYLAENLRCKVFMPEYRTSFKHKFPTPVEDCYSVTKELALNPDKYGVKVDKLGVYGDSAGGCLAAAVCLMARDRGEFKLAFQMLIYPVTDYLMQGESFKLFPDCTWSTNNNIQMWDTYFGGKVPQKIDYASPLHAASHENLPEAYIEPQGIDCLRDDGILYHEKLVKAGVKSELNIIEGSYHGFELEFKNPFTQSILKYRVNKIRDLTRTAK